MKNNKGFSLVELIIVIAIMAVLIGVLAPQYLKYVEKSRISSDKTSVANVKEAFLTVLADEDVYTSITGNTYAITVSNGTAYKGASSTVEKAIGVIVNETVKLTSKTYKNSTVTYTATFDPANSSWSIAEAWN